MKWWQWLLLTLIAAMLVSCGIATGQRAESPPAGTAVTATPSLQARATVLPTSQSGLERVPLRELPPQAAETLELIARNGPFPYDRDGITFQNRERLLPRKPQGYYREYTVPTPGENDRGARRIVMGEEGEIYYTGDHYASFVEVVP